MSKVLVIGCGGVATVAIHKCCQVSEIFTELCIASRTKAKCDKLAAELQGKTATKITTAQVDANGAPFTKNAAKKQASAPILITAGNGHTAKNLKKRALPRCWAAALTRA